MKLQSGRKSIVCRYIENNPITWEEDFGKKGISIKRDGDLAIFNYGIACDFNDPIVQEARGIIIDMTSLNVVCWPFRKFGNYQESYVDDIDWSSARVQEKVDGSIIKLYYHEDAWHFATNSMIDAGKAEISGSSRTFLDVMHSAVNYKDIPFERLNPQLTYIFELVSPETQVVVRYPAAKLYHTGTRDNVTGKELNVDIGIVKPREYPLSTFEDCLDAVKKMNSSGSVKQEGFVVVDEDYHRIKIKSPVYFAVHRSRDGGITRERALKMIREDANAANIIKKGDPYGYMLLSYYEHEYAKFIVDVDRYIEYVRGMYEEFSFDRKAVAMEIKGDKLSAFGFEALNSDASAIELVENTKLSRISGFIREYAGECEVKGESRWEKKPPVIEREV